MSCIGRTAGTQEGHNVHEDRGIFHSGRDTDLIDFEATFSAGTFHYFCQTHGTRNGGMDGIVKVPAKLTAGPAGAAFTVQWASGTTDTGSKYDVQYRIGSGDVARLVDRNHGHEEGLRCPLGPHRGRTRDEVRHPGSFARKDLPRAVGPRPPPSRLSRNRSRGKAYEDGVIASAAWATSSGSRLPTTSITPTSRA